MTKRTSSILCLIAIILSVLLVGCKNGKNETSSAESSKSESEEPSEISEISEESKQPVEESDVEESNVEESNVEESDVEESKEESSEAIPVSEPYEYHGTSIVFPEGFVVTESDDMVQALPGDYPVHTDNINIVFEKGEKVEYYTEDQYFEIITSQNEIFENIDGFDEYENIQIDGHDALFIVLSIDYSGVEMEIVQCIINVSDGAVAYTFTMTSELSAAFEEAFYSIKVTEQGGEFVAEPGETFEYHGTTIVLPEGFVVSEDEDMAQALPGDYPVHTDNITMTFVKDSKITDFSEDLYFNALKLVGGEMFANLEKFDEYKTVKIEGHDALVIRYSIEFYGIAMNFIQCIIEIPEGIVTYTFTIAGDYGDALEASFESISVKK